MGISHPIDLVPKKIVVSNLISYGFTHMLVDGTCAAVIFGGVGLDKIDQEHFALLVVLYNMLAFGLQVTFGELIDAMGKPKVIALAGCLLVGFSLIFIKVPMVAVMFAGCGNAAFHVGGGVVSLRLRPGRAAAPGIFVAPGALGLLLGTIYGREGHFSQWLIAGLLIIGASAIMAAKEPEMKHYIEAKNKGTNGVRIAIALILLSICLRSFVGFMLNYPWKADVSLLFIFTIAVVLGKALGGILSDRLGWTRVTIIGLFLSAVLLPLGDGFALPAVIGVFLFNLTMPVTLTVISNLQPGRPGFSFGLTTLFLLIGAIPSFTSLRGLLYDSRLILGTVLAMTSILYAGLRLYNEKEKMTRNNVKLRVFQKN